MNVDQASEFGQGLRPFATAHAEVVDLKISCNPTSSTDGDTIKHPKGSVLYVISPTKIGLWHSRLGHHGTTLFQYMLPIFTGHAVCPKDANKVGDCVACSQGKLIQRPSRWKSSTKLPLRFQRLQSDVCGPINLPWGFFRYFLVLVDASGMHFKVSLLNTKNMVIPKLLAMLLKFWPYFSDCPIKSLRMDNAKEFRSSQFKDYCLASSISLTYLIAYEHLRNDFIKKISSLHDLFLYMLNFLLVFGVLLSFMLFFLISVLFCIMIILHVSWPQAKFLMLLTWKLLDVEFGCPYYIRIIIQLIDIVKKISM
jgi:hypothetical protein